MSDWLLFVLGILGGALMVVGAVLVGLMLIANQHC